MNCRNCKEKCIKAGKQKGKQKFYCKQCNKYQQEVYSYKACISFFEDHIIKLIKEGCGMRSICKLLGISMNTLLRRVQIIANNIVKPQTFTQGMTYEVDELRTFVGSKKKECWIIYSIERKSSTVIEMAYGARNTENIKNVINSVLLLNPFSIHTDKLNS
jgi:insertion element IS1 protein InsB